MLEIVNDIVQVEHECEALVAAAREEAQRAQTAFDAEERRRLQEAKAAADVRVADRVGAVRERVAKETEERVIGPARPPTDTCKTMRRRSTPLSATQKRSCFGR